MKGGLEDPNLHYPLPPIPPLQHLDVPRSPAPFASMRRYVSRAFGSGQWEGLGFQQIAFLISCRVFVNVRWHALLTLWMSFPPPAPRQHTDALLMKIQSFWGRWGKVDPGKQRSSAVAAHSSTRGVTFKH